MKPVFVKSLVAAGALLAAVGCGGANLGGNTNLFYGSYVGAYSTSSAAVPSGTASPFTIDTSGNVSGDMTASNSGVITGTVVGVATANQGSTTTGTFSGTFTPTNGTAYQVTNATLTWVTVSAASDLDFDFTANGVTYSLILVPQPSNKARNHNAVTH